MQYEAKRFHDGTVVSRVSHILDCFGASEHVAIRFQTAKGDYHYGWFPFDLWKLLPDAGPSELVKQETP